eukprot:TRINITY_DN2381_c0_g1_i1.p1 TRINITY_DN2381_c0_g1~~TRINITY_DN2381_c0_g1_i1.p1  ORF type:complete len:282 (-),score=68.22 TRINITY_DN2381_c0_g1_i1:190-1035(-)
MGQCMSNKHGSSKAAKGKGANIKQSKVNPKDNQAPQAQPIEPQQPAIGHANANSIKKSKNNKKNGNKNIQVEVDPALFSRKRLEDFFNMYKEEPEDGEVDAVIGPDGIEKLCNDLDICSDDVVTLLLAWRLNAQEMGYFTKTEWMEGLEKLNVDTLEKLRTQLPQLRKEMDNENSYKDMYRFAFHFTKAEKEQKVLEIELASAMLSLLLVPRYPLAASFLTFLREENSYKALNLDQWTNLLEFCKISGSDFSSYDENGAWPCIIDEWVEWHKTSENPQEHD